jgi:hypothetical protein
MKNKILIAPFITILFFSILAESGCTTKEKTQIPDPVGTNTYTFIADNKQFDLDLYKSIDDDPNHNYVWIRFGLSSSALNFGFITVNYVNGDFTNSYYNIRYENGGEIVNLGKVDGLGSITKIPTSGWSTSSSAEVGNGYVVRFKHSSEYGNSSLPYYYARFYVTDFVNSTSGGIGFVKAKYQMPFE